MWYVYLLRSSCDGNYYIGQTESVEKRIQEHNNGEVKATRHRRPLELVGYERYASRRDARYREYQLKRHSDKKRSFIRAMEDHGNK